MTIRIQRLSVCLSLALAASNALAAPANPKEPTLGGEPGADLSCVPMPESPAGHFVCEDPDSYQRCKALEGKGKVRVEDDDKATPVLLCQQGG